jgi:hypothetical protein
MTNFTAQEIAYINAKGSWVRKIVRTEKAQDKLMEMINANGFEWRSCDADC